MTKVVAQSAVEFAPPLIEAAAAEKIDQNSSKLDAWPGQRAGRPDCQNHANSNYSAGSHYQAAAASDRGLIPRGSHFNLRRRPTTDRVTALHVTHVQHLVNAHSFAEWAHVGRPLNAGLTITWRHSKRWRGLECWAELQGKVMDQLTRWLLRRRIETAFVWIRETVPGEGPHTHILIHLSAAPGSTGRDLVAWLTPAFEFAPAGVHLSCGKYGLKTAKMRAGLFRYFLKEIYHRMFRYIRLEVLNIAGELGIKYCGEQGAIMIKRSGTSQNIGPAARKAAGWREVRRIEELAVILNP